MKDTRDFLGCDGAQQCLKSFKLPVVCELLPLDCSNWGVSAGDEFGYPW